MDAELKAKWVAALRSGTYQQGRLLLHEGGAFCCLGVLWDCSGKPWDNKRTGVADYGYDTFDELFCAAFGIPSERSRELARMNDDGVSFEVIADYIEREL